jgi:uncharacterized protein YndB with AHSA1/START domain
MSKLCFEIDIDAPRAEVAHLMLAPDSYREWTEPFCPGSCYEGSWEQGAQILFLDPDRNGMRSVIAEHRPGEYVSIKHEGCLFKGEPGEMPGIDWSNAFENYAFIDHGAGTTVKVDVEIPAGDMQQYMNDTWPVALAKLKAICEHRQA